VNRDDGRFNSVCGWSSIDNQRNSATKFILNMLRGGRTDSAKSICARRGQRLSERANDFGKDLMRADSNGDCVETGGYDFRHNRLAT